MDNKEILKAKAVKEINAALKEKAIENFLSKISSQFFQDIVTKFKERCEQKLNTFINNLLNNEEANEFFKNCDEINGKKKRYSEQSIKQEILKKANLPKNSKVQLGSDLDMFLKTLKQNNGLPLRKVRSFNVR